MTEREHYADIAKILSKISGTEGHIEFLNKRIYGLDRKSANARAKALRTRADSDALTDELADVVPGEFYSIPEIIRLLKVNEATPAKATYRLNALVADGILEKGKIEIEGKEYTAYRHL